MEIYGNIWKYMEIYKNIREFGITFGPLGVTLWSFCRSESRSNISLENRFARDARGCDKLGSEPLKN